MTVQDIVTQIPHMTIEDRLAVLEAITQSLRQSITPPPRSRASQLDRLYGAFNVDGSSPTDADIERLRFEALMEKHS